MLKQVLLLLWVVGAKGKEGQAPAEEFAMGKGHKIPKVGGKAFGKWVKRDLLIPFRRPQKEVG